jgi:hypothetical protein
VFVFASIQPMQCGNKKTGETNIISTLSALSALKSGFCLRPTAKLSAEGLESTFSPPDIIESQL